jgi:hypothetical protein
MMLDFLELFLLFICTINKKNLSMRKFPTFSMTFIALLSLNCKAQTIPIDSLYLGQTPLDTPVVFNLPVTDGYFAAERIAISNDGKNIYYGELNGYPSSSGRIKYLTYDNNKWTGPFILFEGFGAPALSATEDTMYLGEAHNQSDSKAYFSVKNNSGWGNPQRFSSKFSLAYYLQESNNGTFYFGSYNANGGLGARDWSRLIINGNDTIIKSLGVPLCTSNDDVDFCVSRNDSFMIVFTDKAYVSYHKNDGSWSDKKLLSTKIPGGWGNYVSSDNKYLFYTYGTSASNAHIYWIKIDNLINIPSSINNQKNIQNIQFYPNPTKDKINIFFGDLINKNAVIEITDIEGKLILSSKIQNVSTTTIDLTGNSKGVYLINLTIDGVMLNKKICLE